MLTTHQIDELLQIIRDQNITFISRNLGESYLTGEELSRLSKLGIDVKKHYSLKGDMVRNSFYFGLISDAMGRDAKGVTFSQLKNYLSSGRFIPITETEKAIIDSVKRQFLGDIKANQGRIFNDVNNIINQTEKNNRKAYEDVIRGEIERGLVDKKSNGEIARGIARKTGDWSRNFSRIVDFVSHQAFDEGRAALIERKYGNEALVYKDTYPGLCKYCSKLYTTSGVGSEPIIFKLSELKANGTNIGRKAAEWKPVIGSTHPHCFDDQTEVLTDKGWRYFKELSGIEKILSLDIGTENCEWVGINKMVSYIPNDKLIHYSGRSFDLMTTANHKHVFQRSSKVKDILLEDMLHFNTSSKFLRTIRRYDGNKSKNIKVGNSYYDTFNFVKFLAIFLSDGSISKTHRGAYQIKITQDKVKSKKGYDITKEVFESLFDKVWCGEGAIYYNPNKSLSNYLLKLGKCNEKFIPKKIKDLSKEYLEVFLSTYVCFDGHIKRGKFWKGCQFNDSWTFYTSSSQLSSDLGEVILKIGKVPSYRVQEPKTSIKKDGGVIKSKLPVWIVSITNSQFTLLSKVKIDEVEYNGLVYDVELEKNHTLFVRRNGRVCVSGNCRCTLHDVPERFDWNKKTKAFDIPVVSKKHEQPDKKRKPVRITFDGKEYLA